MESIRVGFLSFQNYLDRNTWSGILYSMYQVLKRKKIKIIPLGNPQKPSLLKKAINVITKKAPDVRFNLILEREYHQNLTKQVQEQLSKNPCDVIFAPVASYELFFLETPIPIIYLSDATFKLLRENYPLDLDSEKLELREQHETVALAKSSRCIYSSQWAANSAMTDYSVEAKKISVIPFGANINYLPCSQKISLLKKETSPLRLLFIGLNWQRKGGNIAIQTLLSLLKMGIDTQLTIMGSVPLGVGNYPQIKVIPFLNKNSFYERQIFHKILLESHFLILPTRADCSPIVISEANAFGIPVITTDVGGISTIIREGNNGYMLPLSAGGDEYASLIGKLINPAYEYEKLLYYSRQEYEKRLNWDTWAESTVQVFKELLQSNC